MRERDTPPVLSPRPGGLAGSLPKAHLFRESTNSHNPNGQLCHGTRLYTARSRHLCSRDPLLAHRLRIRSCHRAGRGISGRFRRRGDVLPRGARTADPADHDEVAARAAVLRPGRPDDVRVHAVAGGAFVPPGPAGGPELRDVLLGRGVGLGAVPERRDGARRRAACSREHHEGQGAGQWSCQRRRARPDRGDGGAVRGRARRRRAQAARLGLRTRDGRRVRAFPRRSRCRNAVRRVADAARAPARPLGYRETRGAEDPRDPGRRPGVEHRASRSVSPVRPRNRTDHQAREGGGVRRPPGRLDPRCESYPAHAFAHLQPDRALGRRRQGQSRRLALRPACGGGSGVGHLPFSQPPHAALRRIHGRAGCDCDPGREGLRQDRPQRELLRGDDAAPLRTLRRDPRAGGPARGRHSARILGLRARLRLPAAR